jgi:hypothetical protein
MTGRVRRKFFELVIHKLALAREQGYKVGWVWYEVKRELYEGNEFEGFYRSELAYLARRLGYRPRWVNFAYNSLDERYQLGSEPTEGRGQETGYRREPEKEPYSYDDPLSVALAFFDLPRNFSWVQLKQSYRSLCLRYHPDAGGTHDSFLVLQQHYEILQRHAQ